MNYLGDYVSNGDGTATLTDDGSTWQYSGSAPAGTTVTDGGNIGSMISSSGSSSALNTLTSALNTAGSVTNTALQQNTLRSILGLKPAAPAAAPSSGLGSLLSAPVLIALGAVAYFWSRS